MSSKGRGPHEGFATFLTFVGLFSSVNPFMCMKGCVKMESFATFLTPVLFLSVVIALTVFKKFEVTEGFTTFLTFIWLLSIFLILTWFVSSVTFHVSIKGRLTREDFSTYAAFTWFGFSSFVVQIEI